MHIILKTGLCFFLLISSSLVLAEKAAPTETSTSTTPDSVSTKEQSSSVSGKPKQYYIVEVILFRHLNEQGKYDEYWYQPDILEDTDRFTDPISDDIPALAEYDLSNKRLLPLRNGIAALSSSNYKLSDSAAHLRYSPDFEVLAHFGWTQRSLSKNRALPIRIQSNQFSGSLIPSGELKLYVSRYLHMQVDLAASNCEQKPDTPMATDTLQVDEKAQDKALENRTSASVDQRLAAVEADNQCVNNTYQFKQKRKMRSRELHYLDNPLYGMLVYVTPFTAK